MNISGLNIFDSITNICAIRQQPFLGILSIGMRNNVLLLIPGKKAQAAMMAKLQPAYEIHVTENIDEIEPAIRRKFIQLIICAADAHELNGWAVCEQFKSSFHFSHLPFVLFGSGDNHLQLHMKSLQAGADAYYNMSLPREYLQALINNIITNRCKVADYYTSAQYSAVSPLPETDFIKRLHECIAENIHNKVLSVDLLASNMNMSRPTLYRKIKHITNFTPNELIGLTRLKQAALLLASSSHKVFEVAELVGFNSSSGFCKAFLKQYKVTPVEYQRINRCAI